MSTSGSEDQSINVPSHATGGGRDFESNAVERSEKPSSRERVLRLKEGQEVPDSIRRDTVARCWTVVQMPDRTRMSVGEWEEAYSTPTTEEATSRVMQHYVAKIEKELASDSPNLSDLRNSMPHLYHAMEMLGVLTQQTDGLTGNIMQDAHHIVNRAKAFLGNRALRLSMPDEATTKLIAKQGKVVWAMAELEAALPPEAAKKVDTLKHRVADELGAIIQEVGTYIELKGQAPKRRIVSQRSGEQRQERRGQPRIGLYWPHLKPLEWYADKLGKPVDELRAMERSEQWEELSNLLKSVPLFPPEERITVRPEDL